MAEENPVLQKTKSASFPSLDIDQAIIYVQDLEKAYGKANFGRENAAIALGHTGLTGPATAKIATLIQYGLITRSANSYRISDLAEKLLNPIPEDNVFEIKLEIVKNPRIFGSLIDKFMGKSVPTFLGSILIREYGVSKSSSEAAARIFKKSIESVGIYNNGVIGLQNVSSGKENTPNSNCIDNTDKNFPRNNLDMQSITLPSGIVISYPVDLGYYFVTGQFATEIKNLNDKVSEIKISELKNKNEEAQNG